MKQRTIIFSIVLITLILTVFGFNKWNNSENDLAEISISTNVVAETEVEVNINEKNNSDFFFGIGTRFNGIKKEKLHNLKSFDDVIGREHAQRIESYKSLTVVVLEDNKKTDIKEVGTSKELNPAQIKLLQSLDYSTNVLIWAEYIERNKETGELEDNYWTPYLTVTPDIQASYIDGNDALNNYLNYYSKEETAGLTNDKVKPGKIYFTVSKEGVITNVEIVSSTGLPHIDEKIKELVTKLPGTWEPAKDINGNYVDQTLVISFGNMGC